MAVLLLAHQPLLGTQNNEKTAVLSVMGGRGGGSAWAPIVGGRESEAHPNGKESR
jgi:hypothetical protein